MSHQQRNDMVSQLHQLLEGEVDSMKRLLVLLDHETEILSQRDTPALEKITTEKVGLINQLKAIGEQRETLLKEIPGDPIDSDPSVSKIWQDLLWCVNECRKKNSINGSIIEVGFQQAQQALDILHGVSSKADLYDNAGQTSRSAKSSTIARA